MAKFIVPLYLAEKISCHLSHDPIVRIEPWNRQIKDLRMFPDQQEDVPECVAIIEGEEISGNVLDILYKSGLEILPLIFERPFHIYQIGDEESIKTIMSAPYIVDKKGYAWIKYEKLDEFLDLAVKSIFENNLYFALNLHYEIDFRTSAANVQFILHSLLLEHLTKLFINQKMKNPLSEDAFNKILSIVEQDLSKNRNINSFDSSTIRSKYLKIKQNLKMGLSEKSNKQMIMEFLGPKCNLDVSEDFISKIINLRGKMLHDPVSTFKQDSDDFRTLRDLEYLNRIVLIKILGNFKPDYQKFIRRHTLPGFEILKWENF